MKKVISFSLWGEDPKYCVGAVKNAELAQVYYSGWVCKYYIGSSTPKEYVDQLRAKPNTEVRSSELESLIVRAENIDIRNKDEQINASDLLKNDIDFVDLTESE